MDSNQDAGFHNLDKNTLKRLRSGKQYKNLSTVCVVPTRGQIPAKVVQCWMGLMSPMNNAFVRIFQIGLEVGDAYNGAVEAIQNHPQLKEFKYMLTLEEDNMPPPDGLLKLYENIEEYGAIGGLYWTKGPEGQPMIYGDPKEVLNFRPQIPRADTIQECHGLGMGFTLFNLKMFKDKKIPKPWFKTRQEWAPETGSYSATQDLYFFENARKAGYKFACDTRVKVGHYDAEQDKIW